MLFLTQSAAVYGIDALIVDIEVNLRPVSGENDTNNVTIVGLPDTAVRESRVGAIRNLFRPGRGQTGRAIDRQSLRFGRFVQGRLGS